MCRTLTAVSGRSASPSSAAMKISRTSRCGRACRPQPRPALELAPDDVATHDVAVLGHVDAVVDELVLQGVVDALGRDLSRPADAEDAVVALDHLGRGVLGDGEQGLQEGRVAGLVLGRQPAEVAGLLGGGVVGGDGPGDVLPGRAATQVGEGLVGDGPRRRDGLGRRLQGPGLGHGLDLDDPPVAGLGGRGFLEQARIDVGLGDGQALRGRQAGLDLVVDDPLQGDGHDLLALLVDDLVLEVDLGLAQLAGVELGPGTSLGLGQAPALDEHALAQLAARDVSPFTLPTLARFSL